MIFFENRYPLFGIMLYAPSASIAAHSSWTCGSRSDCRRVVARRASRSRSSRPSAHTAAPRTSGESIVKAPLGLGNQRRIPGIADCDQHVAHETIASRAFDRRLREHLSKFCVVEAHEVEQGAAPRALRAPQASRPGSPARTCSTGKPPGNHRSHRCGCPIAARSSRGIVPLCSIVRYEMQRRASSR